MTFPNSTPISATPNLALLIDGENISATFATALLTEARKLGDPAIRRVYGKSEHIAAWDAEGFRLMQTRPGKNAADLLLSIEAMTLALRDGITSFVIASSDGDFVYLATQLRETGATVLGLGEDKAPSAFRNACSRFVVLKPQAIATGAAPKWPATKIIPLVRDILQYTNRPEGWGDLSWIGQHLRRRDADFDSRDYGHQTLESLIEGVKYFETTRHDTGLRLRDPHRKEVAATATLPSTAQGASPLTPHTAP
jgi:hypothetical protein